MSECKHKWVMDPTEIAYCEHCYKSPAEAACYVLEAELEQRERRIAELEAQVELLEKALQRINDASNHYAMTPTYSEGTLRYAHESTRNIAREALAKCGEGE